MAAAATPEPIALAPVAGLPGPAPSPDRSGGAGNVTASIPGGVSTAGLFAQLPVGWYALLATADLVLIGLLVYRRSQRQTSR